VMFVVNKWDLVPREQRRDFKRDAEQKLRFASYIPVTYISAKLGQGVDRILVQAWKIWQERQRSLPASEVDDLAQQAISSYPPPHSGSRRLRIVRAYQYESQPATFVLEVNDPKLLHFSYRRYLENRFRQGFGFQGVPLKLIFRKASRKINDKKKVKAR